MIPIEFPQMNKRYGAPESLDASQVATIPAFEGVIARGNLEGETVVVTAWRPSPEQIQDLIDGRPLYLSFLGGLFPHFPTTRFNEAANPGAAMREFECPNCRAKNSIPEQPQIISAVKTICEGCRQETWVRIPLDYQPS